MSHGALGKLRQPMPRNFLGNISLCQAVVRDQYICDVRRRDLLADAAEILVWGLAANGLRGPHSQPGEHIARKSKADLDNVTPQLQVSTAGCATLNVIHWMLRMSYTG